MSFTGETLNSPSGASLRLRVSAPDGDVRGVVQIHHGLSEHSARYGRFAEYLASRGFAAGAHAAEPCSGRQGTTPTSIRPVPIV